MIRIPFFAMVLVGALALPALGQPAAPAASPDPAARAEATRIVEALNLGALMGQTIDAMQPGLIAQMQMGGRATRQQAEVAVTEVVMPSVRQAVPQMIGGIADIWARHFTAEELRQLLGFYETPVGRKSLAVTPQITAEMQTLIQSILPRIVEDTIARNRDALRQRGLPF